MIGILVPLSIIATTAKLYYDAKETEARNDNLIAGHNMCAPYTGAEVGVFARNDRGQLGAFADTTFRSMDIVVSANLSLVFNALATMFILRLMFYHHARDFWRDWRVWLISIIVFVPVTDHIVQCS